VHHHLATTRGTAAAAASSWDAMATRAWSRSFRRTLRAARCAGYGSRTSGHTAVTAYQRHTAPRRAQVLALLTARTDAGHDMAAAHAALDDLTPAVVALTAYAALATLADDSATAENPCGIRDYPVAGDLPLGSAPPPPAARLTRSLVTTAPANAGPPRPSGGPHPVPATPPGRTTTHP
jgi:hypothetical protein